MDIKELIAECTTYDFKQMLEEKRPKSWLKSVSAFANGVGGSLFFGVSDEGEIVGLDDAQRVAELISEKIKEYMDPLPSVELIPIEDAGKCILELKVKAGTYTPYYYVGDGQRIAFERVGNESVPASAERMVQLVLRGSNQTFDSIVTSERIEDNSFSILVHDFEERTSQQWDKKYLYSFGLVTIEGQLTNAGMLFSDTCSLRQSRLFCTRWYGNEKGDTFNDAEYKGNVLYLLRTAIDFIKSNTHSGWEKLPNGRKSNMEYAERAVFEALVNHFIHRDYTVIGGEVHVDIFDDRLMVTSPGGMYNGGLIQDLDIQYVSSNRRNPVLADVMSQLEYMEKRGSGLEKICNSTRQLVGYTDKLMPKFVSDANQFTTILYRNGANSARNVTYDVTYDDTYGSIAQLTDRQHAILSLVEVNPAITALEMSRMLHVSERTIRRSISEMSYLLHHEGDRNAGRWVINSVDNDNRE